MARLRLHAGELARVTGAALTLTGFMASASCGSSDGSQSAEQAGQGGAATGAAGSLHAAGSHAGGAGTAGGSGSAGSAGANGTAGGDADSAQAGSAGASGGSEAGSDAGIGGTAAGGASGGGAGDDGTAGGSCSPATTYGSGATTVTFSSSVTAVVKDESGAPVSGQPVYICGLNICTNPVNTAGDGSVTISTKLAMKEPAVVFGDAVAYAEYSVPLSMATTEFTAVGQQLVTGKLSSVAGAVLAAGTSATSGDVTLTVAEGGAITIDPLLYNSAELKRFRAVKMPVAQLATELKSASVTGGAASFLLAYSVSPAQTLFCPAAKLSVALPHATTTPNNDLGWAPGTAVEFWVTSSSVQQSFSPFAGWAKMSDGVVSADGHSVTTKAGAHQGFLSLESFAIRKAD